MRSFFSFLLLLPLLSLGQKTFRLEGKIEGSVEEDELILTVYRNWIAPPEDYTLRVDASGKFEFDMILEEMAYLDLNYGLNGLLFQIIEPEDDFKVSFSSTNFYDSFDVTGVGAEKWIYYKNARIGLGEDEDRFFYNLLRDNPKAYLAEVDKRQAAQLAFLNADKGNFSEDFFILRRADIIGKYNSLRLDYYAQDAETVDVFAPFELQSVASVLQSKSFEYGQFVEKLVSIYRQKLNAPTLSNLEDEYGFLFYLFGKGLISKQMAERLMAARIVSDLEANGFSEDNEAIFRDFANFSTNQAFNTYLENKNEKLKAKEIGKPVPSFSFVDFDQKKVSSKSLKGSAVLMVFWSSWCHPCIKDLEYLPIVEKFFKENKVKLKILNFVVDNEADFAQVKTLAEKASIGARLDEGDNLLKDLGVSNVPTYLLFDKNGNWLANELLPASLDEGRALIKQLEPLISK